MAKQSIWKFRIYIKLYLMYIYLNKNIENFIKILYFIILII